MTINQNEIHMAGGLVGRASIVSVGSSLSPIIENNYSLANIEAGSKAGQNTDGANTASLYTINMSNGFPSTSCTKNCGGGLIGMAISFSDEVRVTIKNNFATGQVIAQSSVDTTAVNHAGALAGVAVFTTSFTGKNYFVSTEGGIDGIGNSNVDEGHGCAPSGIAIAGRAAASAAICTRLTLSALQAINQATTLSWDTGTWSKTGEANTWPCLANIAKRFGALNRGCPSDPS